MSPSPHRAWALRHVPTGLHLTARCNPDGTPVMVRDPRRALLGMLRETAEHNITRAGKALGIERSDLEPVPIEL